MLRKKGHYNGEIVKRYNKATSRAVRAYQRAESLPVGGGMTVRTWTAIFAQGRSPVLKRGSAAVAVRRVQRALNAATDSRLTVTGVFGRSTTRAVRGYQRQRGLSRTGVVAGGTWSDLEAGRN